MKVFRTAAGFEDAYVAAPNQAAALKAWGARGDLFAGGEAEVVTDEKLTAEPLASPGTVIRLPRGDMAAMLAAVPKVAKPAKSAEAAGAATGGRKPSSPPPPPDRGALDAAERVIREVRERLAHDLDAIAQERAELDAQERRTRRDGEAAMRKAERARDEAERAFKKAGG